MATVVGEGHALEDNDSIVQQQIRIVALTIFINHLILDKTTACVHHDKLNWTCEMAQLHCVGIGVHPVRDAAGIRQRYQVIRILSRINRRGKLTKWEQAGEKHSAPGSSAVSVRGVY